MDKAEVMRIRDEVRYETGGAGYYRAEAGVTLALCDALLEAWERARGCPCLWTTPCKPNCSCATPILSAGCSRCARYGSDDQRRTTAVHIAAAQEREKGLRRLLRMMTTGVHRVKLCWCTPVPSEESDEHQGKCIAARAALEGGAKEAP